MRIDLDHLRRYTGEDDALIAEVLEMFGEQTAMWLRALDATGPHEGWTSVAHAIKGSARAVGAERLGALCDRAEAMPEDAEASAKAWLREEIAGEIDAVGADIQRHLYESRMRRMRGVG